MSEISQFVALNNVGINQQAVFDLAELPTEITTAIEAHVGDVSQFDQLVLFASSGPQLWTRLNEQGDNPIDDFSRAEIKTVMDEQFPDSSYRFLYPGFQGVPLQQLGALVGWHHESPLKIGINENLGLWFAYRAALLIKVAGESNRLEATPANKSASPCVTCQSQACVSACPANVMRRGGFDLKACMAYRVLPNSKCEATCVARDACPVKPELRYSEPQMAYHYGRSLTMIKSYLAAS